MWARFSSQEMARRWTLARGLMARRDLGGLVLYGNSGVNRHNHANVFWLSNHLDLHHAYLVAPADPSADAALYVGLFNHVPNARQISETPIVAWGGHDPSETVAGRLRDLGLTRGRVGLVGVSAPFDVGMPFQHHRRLTEGLPDVEFVDVTMEYAALRAVKSEEEVAWLTRAAEFTDRAIAALRGEVRAGMREDALLGIIESASRADGGQPHIAFLRSMSMDDPTGCVPAQNPCDRIIARGDVIITEISASYWGYSGQIHRPLFVGADPTPPWRRLFEVAQTAYRRISAAIRPGVTERDVIRAGSIIGEAGFAIYDDLIHGYGVDIHPPVIDRRCASYWPWDETRPAPEGRRFEANMAIVVQPNPITPDERMGLQLGALTLVTPGGAESLQRVPFEPIIVQG